MPRTVPPPSAQSVLASRAVGRVQGGQLDKVGSALTSCCLTGPFVAKEALTDDPECTYACSSSALVSREIILLLFW